VARSMAELFLGGAGAGGGYGNVRVSMPKPRQGFGGGGGVSVPAGRAGETSSGEESAASTKLSCKTCLGVVFDTPAGHREHFRGTWHSRNQRYKTQGIPPVSEEEHRFMEMEEQGHLGGGSRTGAAAGGKGKKGKKGRGGKTDDFEAEFM